MKLSAKIAFYTFIVGTNIASANMLPPTFNAFKNLNIGIEKSNHSRMYLGDWRNQISFKISPNFFHQLSSSNFNNERFDVNRLSKNYFTASSYNFISPIFSKQSFTNDVLDENLFFTFSSKSVKISPLLLNSLFSNYLSDGVIKNSKKGSNLIEQESYSPGYRYSTQNSSIGISALLVQQKFLDDSLSSRNFSGLSPYQFYTDDTFSNINRGVGYQLNISQKLFKNIKLSASFQSKVRMNEFDSYGRSYSDSGDFDIPSRYSYALTVPLYSKNKVMFSSQSVSYSDVNPIVHSGYSENFLRAYNNFLSPVFKLKNLTYYSIMFEQQVNKNLTWNVNVTTRQQASATTRFYNEILTNDTASLSYQLGISQASKYGNFKIFTSIANKPLLIGSTDFGRLPNSPLNNHIEGVASWSFAF